MWDERNPKTEMKPDICAKMEPKSLLGWGMLIFQTIFIFFLKAIFDNKGITGKKTQKQFKIITDH